MESFTIQVETNPDDSLKLDSYNGLIAALTECHPEDLVNILHRVMQARGDLMFDTQSSGNTGGTVSSSVVCQFEVPPVESSPRRLVSMSMRMTDRPN